MESVANTAISEFAAFGPEWLFALVITGAFLILVIKGIPAWEKSRETANEIRRRESEARIELDQKREQRKADEESAREQRDRERSEAEGRWAAQNERAILAQERSNQVMDALAAELKVMNTQFMDSKANSAKLGGQIEDISEKVNDIHHVVVK